MIATYTAAALPAPLRLFRRLMVWQLRRAVSSADYWADSCATGGVLTPAQVDTLRSNITPLRVELARWESMR